MRGITSCAMILLIGISHATNLTNHFADWIKAAKKTHNLEMKIQESKRMIQKNYIPEIARVQKNIDKLRSFIAECKSLKSKASVQLKKDIIWYQDILDNIRHDKKNEEGQIAVDTQQLPFLVAKLTSCDNRIDTVIKGSIYKQLDSMKCCITKKIMKDPVMLIESGYTYERTAINAWFRKGKTKDPMTNEALTQFTLVENGTVRNMIRTYYLNGDLPIMEDPVLLVPHRRTKYYIADMTVKYIIDEYQKKQADAKIHKPSDI